MCARVCIHTHMVKQETQATESFAERKFLLSQNAVLELIMFYISSRGEKDVSQSKEFTLAINKSGWEELKWAGLRLRKKYLLSWISYGQQIGGSV